MKQELDVLTAALNAQQASEREEKKRLQWWYTK
jgi:hypothetical protein